MTDIFAGHHHKLDSRTGNEIHLPECLDRRDRFLFTKLSHRKRLLTPRSFIPSRSLIRVSLNLLMVMSLRYVSNW